MSASIDPRQCPLCGEQNECGMAAGRDACWCFERRIPADVLNQIPPQARNVVCICSRCAGARSPSLNRQTP